MKRALAVAALTAGGYWTLGHAEAWFSNAVRLYPDTFAGLVVAFSMAVLIVYSAVKWWREENEAARREWDEING